MYIQTRNHKSVIQLVLSGDFCQLPPVPDRVNGVAVEPTFAFDADSWNQCVGPPVVLKRVFRQKDQGEPHIAFVDMLNEMRLGNMKPATIKAFQSLSRPVTYTDGIEPTELYPIRREVDSANFSRLHKIPHPAHEYAATDSPGYDESGRPISRHRMEQLLERLVAPKTIVLKVRASTPTSSAPLT
ncbi:hypothetical protein B0H21DRAFT_694015 [Amylocystis lapponica]|nr:hypothetical protein B0H21DRAFT_694015 [Amylocystis lapponica]